MNIRALLVENIEAINTVYNVAYGERTDLKKLVSLLKTYLADYESEFANINVIYEPQRLGDVPHSLASIDKAKNLLEYHPKFDIKKGLQEAVN